MHKMQVYYACVQDNRIAAQSVYYIISVEESLLYAN